MKPSLLVILACLFALGALVQPWLVAVSVAFIGLEAWSPRFQRERAELKKLKADFKKANEGLDKELKEELSRLKTQVSMLRGGGR